MDKRGDRRRATKGVTVKYMMLLWGDESDMADMTPEQGAAAMQRWSAYTEELVAAGAMVSGDGLQPSATATTVRLDAGERVLSDGPFAETKEQIGGFYVIDCENLDQAIEWAAKTPSALDGRPVEVRPVIDYEARNGGTP
jgi:hypothetical protein